MILSPPQLAPSRLNRLALTALLASACSAPAAPAQVSRPTAQARLEALGDLSARHQAYRDAQRQLAATPLQGFVLLPHNATLYASAQAALKATPALPEPRFVTSLEDHVERRGAFVFTVVEDRGAAIKVRSLTRSERREQCEPEALHPLLDHLIVEAWVHREALLLMLSERFVRSFEDGTGYAFGARTPVWPAASLDASAYVLAMQGVQLEAPHSDSEREALSYALSYASAPSPLVNPPKQLGLPSDAIAWVGGEPALRAAHLPMELRRIRARREIDAQLDEVTLATPCLQLVAQVPKLSLMRSAPQGALRPMLSSASGTSTALPPDARSELTLYWPDGSEAGRWQRRALRLPGEPDQEASAESQMQCVRSPLPLDQPLCVLPKPSSSPSLTPPDPSTQSEALEEREEGER